MKRILKPDPFSGISLFLLMSFLIGGCGSNGPEYHKLREGIAFRRVSLGDGEARVKVGDGVGARFRFSPLKDPERTLLKDTGYFLLDNPNSGLCDVLTSMSRGDSSIFRLKRIEILGERASIFRKKLPDSLEGLRMEVKLLERRKPSALMKWKEKRDTGALDQESWKEWKKIRAFVNRIDKNPEEHFVEGIYLFPLEKGNGPPIRVGRRVSVHYKGYLPDSTVFDNSYARGEPLRFKFGAPEQVIRGMGIALKYMREGGKAKAVIPSYLAFGKKGGRTGILPPHTFVYYEIEVIDVKIS